MNLWVLATLLGLSGFLYLTRLAFKELDKTFSACPTDPPRVRARRGAAHPQPTRGAPIPHRDESFAAFHRKLRREQLLDELSLTRRRLP